MVLLKNDGQRAAALARPLRSVALIGPLGDDRANMLGNWIGDGKADDVVTAAGGLESGAARRATITYTARRTRSPASSTAGFDEAVARHARPMSS